MAAKSFVKCSYPCVVTRKESVSRAVPRTVGARFKLLSDKGACSFIIPEGTPASPGSPNYPLVNKRGCFHCGMARAAYTRIGQSLSRSNRKQYKDRLIRSRRHLIKIALSYADPADKGNACNWALAASRRYL